MCVCLHIVLAGRKEQDHLGNYQQGENFPAGECLPALKLFHLLPLSVTQILIPPDTPTTHTCHSPPKIPHTAITPLSFPRPPGDMCKMTHTSQVAFSNLSIESHQLHGLW
ncbi:bcl-2 homologous antagonist/killer [Platysternon megacephalum]|uniref:Bcl-2 homologous antagonist/killer n=1 Tax=Platysternon megacephalum TaxID=55544 RepID=A0A4D9EA10_9SAUR|nr:bcl-2 homologous antagonist/killer [Platysternon megacephalum]